MQCRKRVDAYALAHSLYNENHQMHYTDDELFLYKDDYGTQDLIALLSSNVFPRDVVEKERVKGMITFYEEEIKKARTRGFLAGAGAQSGATGARVGGEIAGGLLKGLSNN
jgi:hypothetical protein